MQIEECTVVYFPQLGYLLAIPRTDGVDPQPIPGLEFQVRAGGSFFLDSCVKLCRETSKSK